MKSRLLVSLLCALAMGATASISSAALSAQGRGSTQISGDNMGIRDADVTKTGTSQISLQSIRNADVAYFDSNGQMRGYHTEVQLVGSATAGYGALAGSLSAHVIASSSDPNGSFALARAFSSNLGVNFDDSAIVQSATLANNTPVTLTFTIQLASSFVFTRNPPVGNADNGASVTFQGVVSDSLTGSFPGFTLANGTGGATPGSATLTLNTAVGHSIRLFADLSVGVAAQVLDTGFGAQAEITAAVDAAHTGYLTFTQTPGTDITLLAASGHNYAVPEPGSLALLTLGSILVGLRRSARG